MTRGRGRWLIVVLLLAAALAPPGAAEAATITASYAAGYRDVVINGYGASGMGTFRLTDGDTTALALCIEAAESHSTAPDAYAPVATALDSPELDALLWLHRDGAVDDDTAVAMAALAWYLAGAQRRGGGAVWSNSAAHWAPIDPASPEAWDALAPFSLAHPVGLRAGGRDLDTAEARVLELFHLTRRVRGPWTMAPMELADGGSSASVTISGPDGPIAGVAVVRFVARDAAGAVVSEQVVTTGEDGTAAVSLAALPTGGTVEAWASAPGAHREWDGAGVQRMATPTEETLHQVRTLAPPPTTTTTTTTTTPPPTTTTTSPPTTTSTSTTTTTSTTSTTTTTTPTPSTSAPTTPPTTTPPTTTPPTSPPTTVPPPTTAAPIVDQSAPVPPAQLPRTGADDDRMRVLVHAGEVLFGVGLALALAAELLPRRRDDPPAP